MGRDVQQRNFGNRDGTVWSTGCNSRTLRGCETDQDAQQTKSRNWNWASASEASGTMGKR